MGIFYNGLKAANRLPQINQIQSFESAPITLKKRKPRSNVLSLPKQHRVHRGTHSNVNQYYKLCETYRVSAFVAKKDLSWWTQLFKYCFMFTISKIPSITSNPAREAVSLNISLPLLSNSVTSNSESILSFILRLITPDFGANKTPVFFRANYRYTTIS